MNNEPVTREEFDRLLGYANTLADLLREQNRIVGEHLANSGRLTNRLAAAERLLHGVKDAVGLVADHAVVDLDRAKETGHLQGRSLYAVASETIARAQQPPATATGEPVDLQTMVEDEIRRTIDPAASAAATTNERATETWLLNDDAPPPAQTDDVP